MLKSEFQVGDVVCLNSGGVSMTVERVDNIGITCIWIDGGRRLQRQTFNPGLLKEDKGKEPVHLTICTHYPCDGESSTLPAN